MERKKIICVMAIIIITALIFSLNFKTNFWNKNVIGRDASVFVTIGESIHEGRVPYRDVFDHKGPMLYFINYIGTILPGYILLYLIELMFLIIDLIIMYKIAKYITKDDIVSCASALIAIISLPILLQGGNFVEEYALPFILFALYIFIKKDKITKDYIFSGLTLGAVILLRANMIAVWIIGYLFISIELLYKKNFKEFFKAIIFSCLGLIIIILPFVIYLIANGAFNDFINQYIIFNIKYSDSNGLSPWQFLIQNNFGNKYLTGIVLIINILLLIIYIVKKDIIKIKDLIFSLLFTILSVIIVIMPTNLYLHYAMILIPCYIIPISYLMKLLIKKKEILYIIISCMLIIILSLTLQNKIADVYWGKATYNTSKYISSISDKDDDVLVIGNHCIIYLLSERKTDCKYIYQFPPIKIDENIKNEITNYINENLPDLIIYTEDFEDYFKRILEDLIKEGKYKQEQTDGYPIFIKVEGE